MVALCCLMDASIGHGDTQSDFKALSVIASEIGYPQEQIEVLLKDVAEAYKKDGGRRLIDSAFPRG